jgi:hypothetical protein
MGAIVSDFVGLPADVPGQAGLYQKAYDDLTALGIPLPAQLANVITRAQLLAHLQAQAGALIKAELAGDPDGVGFGAATDAQAAVLISNPYVLGGVRRFPNSNATGYQAAAGSTAAGLVVVTNPALANPLLLALSGLPGAGMARFRNSAATVANRGVIVPVQFVPTDTTLTVAVPFPGVPTVGDIFDLGLINPAQLPPRLSQILRRFPYAPNILTTADVTAAKV